MLDYQVVRFYPNLFHRMKLQSSGSRYCIVGGKRYRKVLYNSDGFGFPSIAAAHEFYLRTHGQMDVYRDQARTLRRYFDVHTDDFTWLKYEIFDIGLRCEMVREKDVKYILRNCVATTGLDVGEILRYYYLEYGKRKVT